MKKLSFPLTLLLVCSLLLGEAQPAEAQSPAPTGPQATAIFAILIGVPVAIGFGVYYAVRAPRHVEGCVSEQGGSLQLVDAKHREYLLSGEVQAIQPDKRLRLSGKAGKDAKERRIFVVKRIMEDYGACPAGTPHP